MGADLYTPSVAARGFVDRNAPACCSAARTSPTRRWTCRAGCAKKLREGSPPIDVLTKVNHSHVAAVDWDKDTYLSKRQPGPDRLRIVACRPALRERRRR